MIENENEYEYDEYKLSQYSAQRRIQKNTYGT